MDKLIKIWRGLELVTSCSLGHETSSQKFIYSLCIIWLSDQVWRCNVKQFLSYSKNYICKFMQANSWHHKLFHFHLPFWIWKVWKGREKITEIWISGERKELFRWNKIHFSVFKGLSFCGKIKIPWKIADTDLMGEVWLVEFFIRQFFTSKFIHTNCFFFLLEQKKVGLFVL